MPDGAEGDRQDEEAWGGGLIDRMGEEILMRRRGNWKRDYLQARLRMWKTRLHAGASVEAVESLRSLGGI